MNRHCTSGADMLVISVVDNASIEKAEAVAIAVAAPEANGAEWKHLSQVFNQTRRNHAGRVEEPILPRSANGVPKVRNRANFSSRRRAYQSLLWEEGEHGERI